MKRRSIVMRAMAVVCVAMAATAVVTGDSRQPSVRQLRAVLDRQVQALNRGDLGGFMDCCALSLGLTFYSDSTATSGWDQTIERYRRRYRSEGNVMGMLEFRDLKIEMLGPQAAFVRGRYNLKAKGTESTGLFTL